MTYLYDMVIRNHVSEDILWQEDYYISWKKKRLQNTKYNAIFQKSKYKFMCR